ncbi:hypothetical protein HPB50_027479 [Hyalomma asiaticum]|uniref:Uncharacterized protein n=1 Tax=Hyalomma asiaticum TaxID=266040 RepID=A0ACB7T4X6_HYAAI|nr:hypothetical protein HPB50_027479 [Hyalomma asiaticum]
MYYAGPSLLQAADVAEKDILFGERTISARHSRLQQLSQRCSLPLAVFATLLLLHRVLLASAGGAGGLLPEVEPVEAAQIAKYLPLIQQIEAIERIKAIKAIKSQSKGDSLPPFLPIVIALHHKSEQQQSGKKKHRLFSLFS